MRLESDRMYLELMESIGVLEKSSFRFIGEGSEAGVIRYQIVRP